MSNLNVILQSLLKCGYLDIEFLDEEIKRFQVDVDEIIEYHSRSFDGNIGDFNTLIYCLYQVAFNTALDELGYDGFDGDKFETFCNCLDSHCYMRDNEDECSEMYSYEDIVNFLKTHYPKSE